MSNIIELKKKAEELEAELQKLKEELVRVQDEHEIPDKPDFEMDDKFYYLNSETDDVEGSYYDGDIDNIDFNMFHTEEYAKEFASKCKLIAMMLHCKWCIDRDFIQDWGDPLEHKWQLYYDHDENKMVVAAYSRSDFSVVFSTEEKAQKCADWLNEHWRDSE